MKINYWIIILLSASLVALAVSYARLASRATETALNETSSSAEAVLECIRTRASVRQYSDRSVPDSVITEILKAGMAAPSGANCQPWELVVVTERVINDTLAAGLPFAKMLDQCAFSVAVCGNMGKIFHADTRDSGLWIQDCSAVSENMLLAAHALGLGGVWCGIFPVQEREELMQRVLNLPDSIVPMSILSFGYPASDTHPKNKWTEAKVHYNKF